MKPAKLTTAQRHALDRLARGKSLRGYVHGVTINHLKMKRLIEDSDTITDAGRAAIAIDQITNEGVKMNQVRELNPALTHRIVCAEGHWARGATLADAKAQFRQVRGKAFDKCFGRAIWAVTGETSINDTGRFSVPPPFAQPADVTDGEG